MTDKQRTAAEIRAYLRVFEYGLAIAKTPRKRRAYYANLGISLRTDLPAVLDAAAGLYKILVWLVAQEGRKLTEHEAFELGSYLNGLAWLAEGPVPEGPLARAWREACSGDGDDGST